MSKIKETIDKWKVQRLRVEGLRQSLTDARKNHEETKIRLREETRAAYLVAERARAREEEEVGEAYDAMDETLVEYNNEVQSLNNLEHEILEAAIGYLEKLP